MDLSNLQNLLLIMVVVAAVLILMNRTASRAAQRLDNEIEASARDTIRQKLVDEGMDATRADAEAAQQAKALVREREMKTNRSALIFAGIYVAASIVTYLFDPLLGVIIAFFALVTLAMALWQFVRLRRRSA